jgi:hypothetical protein
MLTWLNCERKSTYKPNKLRRRKYLQITNMLILLRLLFLVQLYVSTAIPALSWSMHWNLGGYVKFLQNCCRGVARYTCAFFYYSPSYSYYMFVHVSAHTCSTRLVNKTLVEQDGQHRSRWLSRVGAGIEEKEAGRGRSSINIFPLCQKKEKHIFPFHDVGI